MTNNNEQEEIKTTAKTIEIIQSFIKVAQMRKFDLDQLFIDKKFVTIRFRKK